MTKDILWTQNISKLIDDEHRPAAGGNRGLVRRREGKIAMSRHEGGRTAGNPAAEQHDGLFYYISASSF